MQLHEVTPIHKNKSKKRIGRGGKRGTYSGRGMKGQKSRSGHKIRPAIRDLMQRTPKLRGSSDKPAHYRKIKKIRKEKKAKKEQTEEKKKDA